jgi:hypothetical protein
MTATDNTITGLFTITQAGSVLYTLHQINTNGSDNYDLSGGGTNTYSQTTSENSLTGQSSTTGGGSDAYSLTQTGASGGSGGGSRSYTLTLVGTDAYTLNNTDNAQIGTVSDITTGGGAYTLSETGTDSGTPFTTGSTGNTGFSQTQAGNLVDGQITLSQSGTNRYNLLEQFNNPSEAGQGAPDIAGFSPIGNPVMIGTVPAVTGTFVDPDARHLYCFAKGTLILLADGTSQAIETIEAGQMVLAAPDTDPEAAPAPCKVVQVYHNAPARVFEVHVAGEVIRTTANHPFYVKGNGWVKVQDLAVADELRTQNGAWLKIQKTEESQSMESVFNLQVEGDHTYFVVLPASRQAAVLVHNDSQSVAGGFFSDWGNYYKQAAQSTWNATKTVAAKAIVGVMVNLVQTGVVTQAGCKEISVAYQKYSKFTQSETHHEIVGAILNLSMFIPGEGAAVKLETEGAALLKGAETGATVVKDVVAGEGAAAQQEIRFFKSYKALYRALGPAGEGKVWHHIVEQRAATEFGSEAINNTQNVVAVSREVNQALADYYASVRPFTGGQTVRQWLTSQSWREQFEFGQKMLSKVLAKQPLP